MKRSVKAAVLGVLVALLALPAPGCGEESNPPRDPIGGPDPSTTAATSATPTSLPDPAAPNPAPGDPASADPATATADADAGPPSDAGATTASPEALAGTWEGPYDAKKSRVDMPPGVKDDARTADDGKTAVGPGLVRITVTLDGDVSGKSEGALGASIIRGKLDGKMLRASFVPSNPLAKQAMTGVLIGLVKGDVIRAELKVAGPDALLVRQAIFDLKKK